VKIKIEKGIAKGRITAPPSKSMAHRMLICAAMSEGESVIRGISECEDVLATLDCLSAMGVPFERNGDTVRVRGIDMKNAAPSGELKCRESGSTLRFLVPICLLSGNNTMLVASGSLMRRPMSVYAGLSKEKGFTFLQDERSVIVKGPLKAGEYRVAGDISSQFISGLLFALPTVEGDSRINIIPPIESRSYINLTISALSEFGINVQWEDDHTLFIKGGQKYKAVDTSVEGDYSNAAFLSALSVLGGDVSVDGLKDDSLQGDRVYSKLFDMLCKGTPTIHIGNCPDLGPVLFAVAAAKYGGVFTGTSRLRIKESDRGAAMAEELKKFGTAVSIHNDTIVVYPAEFHAPTDTLAGHGDHRIVMSLAVLCTLTGGEIEGAEAVAKSYPDFFDAIKALGVKETVLNA
jgi:3-phosphoshikimate 1-carboxyvinyltransferase